jgi:hypothetical protein
LGWPVVSFDIPGNQARRNLSRDRFEDHRGRTIKRLVMMGLRIILDTLKAANIA